MSSLSWVIDIVSEEVGKKVRSAIQRNAQSSREEIKMARGRMINEWFGEFNGYRWIAKDKQIVHTSWHVSGINGSLTIDSYTTSDGIGAFDKAEEWRSRHGGGESSTDYVSNLIWHEGIIGLPLTSTVSDWTNPNFHKKEPLEGWVINNPEWDVITEKIKNNILKEIN